jgi:hypothetical protein
VNSALLLSLTAFMRLLQSKHHQLSPEPYSAAAAAANAAAAAPGSPKSQRWP